MENKHHPVDEMLKSIFERESSELPSGFLNKILTEKESKKRRGFFWIPFVSGLIVLGSIGILLFKTSIIGVGQEDSSITFSKNSKSAEVRVRSTKTKANPTKVNGIKTSHAHAELLNRNATQKNTNLNRLWDSKSLDVFDKDHSISDVIDSKNVFKAEDVALAASSEHMLNSDFQGNPTESELVDSGVVEPLVFEMDTQVTNQAKKNLKGKEGLQRLEFQGSLGYAFQRVNAQFSDVDPLYTNRNYTSVVENAVRGANGFQMNLGLRYNVLPKWFVNADFGYHYSSTSTQYKTQIKEVPVIDQDQKIVGYLKLADSNVININTKYRSTFHQVSVPLMFGYNFNVKGALQLNAMLGIALQYSYYSKIALPNSVNIQDISNSSLKGQFTLPISTAIGVYKPMDKGEIGLLLSANPIKTKVADMPNMGTLRSSTFTVALQWVSKI